jgi:hypothetical protein
MDVARVLVRSRSRSKGSATELGSIYFYPPVTKYVQYIHTLGADSLLGCCIHRADLVTAALRHPSSAALLQTAAASDHCDPDRWTGIPTPQPSLLDPREMAHTHTPCPPRLPDCSEDTVRVVLSNALAGQRHWFVAPSTLLVDQVPSGLSCVREQQRSLPYPPQR